MTRKSRGGSNRQNQADQQRPPGVASPAASRNPSETNTGFATRHLETARNVPKHKSPTPVNWSFVSLLLAAMTMAAASIFGAIQARFAANAVILQRQATEMQTLTYLHDAINRSTADVARYESELLKFHQGTSSTLSVDARVALSRAMNDAEYLAWLFNHGHLALPGAGQLWAGPIKDLRNLKLRTDARLSGIDTAQSFAAIYPEITQYLQMNK